MNRQKAALMLLIVYWPVIFILTHIFLPQYVLNQLRASDKALHFLVYFILIVLLWISISPDRKADLRSKKVWIVFAVLIFYAGADEWLQGLSAGRTRDIMDFAANAEGLLAGGVLICIFSFAAVLIETAASIVIFTIAVRIQLTGYLEFIRPMFLLISFGLFTFFWCEFLTFYKVFEKNRIKWLISSISCPAGLVAAIKIVSKFTGRSFELEDFLFAAVAIFAVIAIIYVIRIFSYRFH